MQNTRNAYQLASLADCGSPKNSESPGAKMLLGIAEEIYDRAEEIHESAHPEDFVTELVDGWPSIYTSEMWEQFLDLLAWQGQPETEGDMVAMAYACLYQIGERLARALWDEILETLTELCEDCGADLSDAENVVCSGCGDERVAQDRAAVEAGILDDEAQVEGDSFLTE